LKQV
jgi:hypothetical protein